MRIQRFPCVPQRRKGLKVLPHRLIGWGEWEVRGSLYQDEQVFAPIVESCRVGCWGQDVWEPQPRLRGLPAPVTAKVSPSEPGRSLGLPRVWGQ